VEYISDRKTLIIKRVLGDKRKKTKLIERISSLRKENFAGFKFQLPGRSDE
jgi:hypothetical protein